jgi:hypothetical protein
MKEDRYGPLLTQAVQQSERPLSASELREAVEDPETGNHPSIQRVYAWLTNNKPNLREVGRTTKGGTTYTWKGQAMGRQGTRNGAASSVAEDDDKALEVGHVLTVVGIKWVSGNTVIELEDQHGGLHHWLP